MQQLDQPKRPRTYLVTLALTLGTACGHPPTPSVDVPAVDEPPAETPVPEDHASPLAGAIGPQETLARVVSILASLDLAIDGNPNPEPTATTPLRVPQGLVTMTVRGPRQDHWPHSIPEFLLVQETYETPAQAQARNAVFQNTRHPPAEVDHSYRAKVVFCLGTSVFFISTFEPGIFELDLNTIARHIVDGVATR